MKTAIKKVNQLRHVVNVNNEKGNYKIEIRLSDPCKNGHNDFAITATFWEIGQPRIDRNMITAGSCHEEILKSHPELKIFVDLHLADVNGAPMYAIGSGFYHLKEMNAEQFAEYYGVTPTEAKQLKTSEDETVFTYNLMKLGLPTRRKANAKKAIQILEELTGQKFKDDSKKLQKVELSKKELTAIEDKINAGYYAPARIQERKEIAVKTAKEQVIKDIIADRDRDIKKATDERNVQLAVVSAGLPLSNFIYYNHTNEGVFNWNTSSYNKAVTEDQFIEFIRVVKTSNLPKGIKFKLGK